WARHFGPGGAHVGKRTFQPALRIKNEISRGHYLVTRFQSLLNSVVPFGLYPHHYLSRREVAVSFVHEYILLGSSIEHRILWDSQVPSEPDAHLEIHKHVGLQIRVLVRKLQPDLAGASRRIQIRIDIGNGAGQGAAERLIRHIYFYPLPLPD